MYSQNCKCLNIHTLSVLLATFCLILSEGLTASTSIGYVTHSIDKSFLSNSVISLFNTEDREKLHHNTLLHIISIIIPVCMQQQRVWLFQSVPKFMNMYHVFFFKEYAHALSELQLTRSLRLTLHINYIFQLCST